MAVMDAEDLDMLLASALEEMEVESKPTAPGAIKPKGKGKKGKKKAAKASDAFVSTKKRTADLVSGEPPSFLDDSEAALWKELVVAPSGQPVAPQQPPFSRAYRSFTVASEAVTVHTGSGGAAGDSEQASEKAPAPAKPAANLEKKAALRLYSSTLGAAVAAAGTIEPTMSTASNVEMKARLTKLYLRQLAVDLKPRVKRDPDFDAKRFPATAARILA